MTIDELRKLHKRAPKALRTDGPMRQFYCAAHTSLPTLLDFVDAVRKARGCNLMDRCDFENVHCGVSAFCNALRDLDEMMEK